MTYKSEENIDIQINHEDQELLFSYSLPKMHDQFKGDIFEFERGEQKV